MITEFFQQYMRPIQQKYELHQRDEPERNDRKKYADGLVDEVREVKEEARDDNAVYLEDELGDILWDYMNMLYIFEQEGKIGSIQAVFDRSMKKYSERVEAVMKGSVIAEKKSYWDEVKKKQKEGNRVEHEMRYLPE
jgi:NTP pyrophosphatase (non-canonical NTP hydrolase)